MVMFSPPYIEYKHLSIVVEFAFDYKLLYIIVMLQCKVPCFLYEQRKYLNLTEFHATIFIFPLKPFCVLYCNILFLKNCAYNSFCYFFFPNLIF